jgi:hypothetical protein
MSGASALQSGSALSELREELQLIFAQSCINVGAAGTCLMETATVYAEADDEIRGDFESKMSTEFESSEPSEPPRPPFPSGRTPIER